WLDRIHLKGERTPRSGGSSTPFRGHFPPLAQGAAALRTRHAAPTPLVGPGDTRRLRLRGPEELDADARRRRARSRHGARMHLRADLRRAQDQRERREQRQRHEREPHEPYFLLPRLPHLESPSDRYVGCVALSAPPLRPAPLVEAPAEWLLESPRPSRSAAAGRPRPRRAAACCRPSCPRSAPG